ncbi:hypothetical protein BGZ47_008982 [Haplosporangium gracile]|nr:hypothetical protein BGZ47_008982 [Haplosporangium gracile]
MPVLKPLPAKVFALIFHYLNRRDLYRCMLVCQLWHTEVEARLYNNIILDNEFSTHDLIVQAVQTRKHLLRRVQWSSINDQETWAENPLDILLDFRAGEEDMISSSFSSPSHVPKPFFAPVDINLRSLPSPSTLHPVVYPPGFIHPPWMPLSTAGGNRSTPAGGYQEMYTLDMDRVLTAFPHLKHLSISGRAFHYATTSARVDDHNLYLTTADTTSRPGGQIHHLNFLIEDPLPDEVVVWYSAVQNQPEEQEWDKLVENRRLRKRRQIENRDLMPFLRIRSSLRRFALKNFCVPFELLVDDSSRSQGSLSDDNNGKQIILPWACEKTLEFLKIGFNIATDQPENHKLAWKHLGRFKKLRC